jgi:TorA maturation chaperone TorD
MVGDRELAQFRQQYYRLLVNLLSQEPTAEKLHALGQNIAERAEGSWGLHPLLGEGWTTLAAVLPGRDEDAAREEFLRLFIGPLQPVLTLFESHYLTGKLFQKPLADVREFMRQVGLERIEERFPEPEDGLVFELEIMNWLVTRQLAASSPEEENDWLHRQGDFLKHHLLVWGPAGAEDMERAEPAVLYRGVGLLARGLLALERQWFQARGLTDVETLEQARRRHAQAGVYRGPIFDPEGLAESKASEPKGS